MEAKTSPCVCNLCRQARPTPPPEENREPAPDALRIPPPPEYGRLVPRL